jgi:hypothetical protein
MGHQTIIQFHRDAVGVWRDGMGILSNNIVFGVH